MIHCLKIVNFHIALLKFLGLLKESQVLKRNEEEEKKQIEQEPIITPFLNFNDKNGKNQEIQNDAEEDNQFDMMIVTKGHNDHICNEIQNNEQEICESQSDKMDQESDVLQQTSVKSDNQSVQNSKQTSVKSDNQSEQNSKQTSVKSDNQSEQNPVES